MGNEKVTVQNLEIVKIDAENNLIALKGAIPGPKGGYRIHRRLVLRLKEGGSIYVKGFSL